MTTHPFQPNPRTIGGLLCQICNKPRTNTMHEGEGEIPPIEQEEEQMSPEQEQAFITQLRRKREMEGGIPPEQTAQLHQPEYDTAPIPTNFFSIRAAEHGTEVILVVPNEIPNEQVLGAVIAFMEAVKPAVYPKEEAAPHPKKKR